MGLLKRYACRGGGHHWRPTGWGGNYRCLRCRRVRMGRYAGQGRYYPPESV